MFFNITNHPHDKWGERQRSEARRLGGEIVDIPFPNVPPEIGTEGLVDLGVVPVAATSERRVTETPQGKVSVFEFCQFRRYI